MRVVGTALLPLPSRVFTWLIDEESSVNRIVPIPLVNVFRRRALTLLPPSICTRGTPASAPRTPRTPGGEEAVFTVSYVGHKDFIGPSQFSLHEQITSPSSPVHASGTGVCSSASAKKNFSLQFAPVDEGEYEGSIIMTAPDDVRVFVIKAEVVKNAPGHLVFPGLGGSVEREITLTNKT